MADFLVKKMHAARIHKNPFFTLDWGHKRLAHVPLSPGETGLAWEQRRLAAIIAADASGARRGCA
ncbi:MAG: hypothetical protein AB7O63_17470, partial [Reyranellaceae bacterium]